MHKYVLISYVDADSVTNAVRLLKSHVWIKTITGHMVEDINENPHSKLLFEKDLPLYTKVIRGKS